MDKLGWTLPEDAKKITLTPITFGGTGITEFEEVHRSQMEEVLKIINDPYYILINKPIYPAGLKNSMHYLGVFVPNLYSMYYAFLKVFGHFNF